MAKISTELELELIRRAQQNDRLALNRLLRAYHPLVIYIARKYNGTGVYMDDLTSAGCVGLWKAIIKYDRDRNTKPSTYFYKGIELYVNAEKKKQESKSNQAQIHRRRVIRAVDDFINEFERAPLNEEIAERTDVKISIVEEIMLKRVPLSPDSITDEQQPPTEYPYTNSWNIILDTLTPPSRAKKYIILRCLRESPIRNPKKCEWNNIADDLRNPNAILMEQNEFSEWTFIYSQSRLPNDIPLRWESITSLFREPPPLLTYVNPTDSSDEIDKARKRTGASLRQYYSRASEAVSNALIDHPSMHLFHEVR